MDRPTLQEFIATFEAVPPAPILLSSGLGADSPRYFTPAMHKIWKTLEKTVHGRLWMLIRAPPLSGKTSTAWGIKAMAKHFGVPRVLHLRCHSRGEHAKPRGMLTIHMATGGDKPMPINDAVPELLEVLTSGDILILDDCGNWYWSDEMQFFLHSTLRAMKVHFIGLGVSRYKDPEARTAATWAEVWQPEECLGLGDLLADTAHPEALVRFRASLDVWLQYEVAEIRLEGGEDANMLWEYVLRHTRGHLGHIVRIISNVKAMPYADIPTYITQSYHKVIACSRGGCEWSALAANTKQYIKTMLRAGDFDTWLVQRADHAAVQELVAQGVLWYINEDHVQWTCPVVRSSVLLLVLSDSAVTHRQVSPLYAKDPSNVTLADALSAVTLALSTADWLAIDNAQSTDKATLRATGSDQRQEAVYQLYLHSALAAVSTAEQIITPELPVYHHSGLIAGRIDVFIDSVYKIGWESVIGDPTMANGPHHMLEHGERWLEPTKYGKANFRAAVTCCYLVDPPAAEVVAQLGEWNMKHTAANVVLMLACAPLRGAATSVSVWLPGYSDAAIKLAQAEGRKGTVIQSLSPKVQWAEIDIPRHAVQMEEPGAPANKRRRLDDLHANIASKRKAIESQQSVIASKQSAISGKQGVISGKQSAIDDIRSMKRHATSTDAQAQLEAELAEHKAELAEQKAELAEQKTELGKLEAEIAERKAELGKLEAELAKVEAGQS